MIKYNVSIGSCIFLSQTNQSTYSSTRTDITRHALNGKKDLLIDCNPEYFVDGHECIDRVDKNEPFRWFGSLVHQVTTRICDPEA